MLCFTLNQFTIYMVTLTNLHCIVYIIYEAQSIIYIQYKLQYTKVIYIYRFICMLIINIYMNEKMLTLSFSGFL